MAVTKQTYDANGTQTQFTLPFEYIAKADVDVYIDSVLQLQQNTASTADPTHPQVISGDITQGTALINYTFVNDTTIAFNSAPTNGAFVFIERTTQDSSVVTFVPGSTIRAQELNEALEQVRFMAQEGVNTAKDGMTPSRENSLSLDARGLRVEHVADANTDDDAVNRAQLGKVITDDLLEGEAIDLTDVTGGSNSNKQVTISVEDSSKTNKGAVTINEGEGIDVTYTNGNAVIAGEDSSKTNKGVVSINEGHAIGVTYTAGDAVITADKSTATQQGVVKIQQADAANVTYTADGEVTVGVDRSTASQQGVVRIQSTTPVTTTYTADGEVELSIADGSVDISKIKPDDIITTAEQDAGSPSWVGLDDALATVGALEKRHDVLYQSTTPAGTDWQVGKLWYNHPGDQTLYIWNGSNWLGVVSGGTFVTQPTVIWVDSVNGDDQNDGHRVIDPMKTIKAAVTSADAGDIVLVAPGVYREAAPIDITVNNLSIIGQSLRSCFVHPTPATEESVLFRVNSGTQIANFSMAGMKASGTRGGHAVDSDPTYGLPANQGWAISFYPNSVIYKSPYIQNCTTFMDSGIYNHTQAEYNANNSLGGFFDPNNVNQGGFGGDRTSSPTGGGMFIDGNAVSSTSPLRSMVVDSFTQINLDGPGALVCNNAYAQFVSFFGTFTHYHCKSLNGGRVNLSNCTTDYGRYGLVADGKSSSPIYSSTAQAAASAGDTYVDIAVASAPSGWFGSGTHATRPADDMLMEIGSDIYTITGSTTLGTEQNPTGYRVNVVRTRASNRSINDGLINAVSSGATVNFYFRSYISSGGHTFEYVGAGTDYDAAPENGGQPIEANRVIERNNGAVWQSSTDHNGKFTVGNFMVVDQKSGLCTINNINGLAFPSSDGQQNQVLSTDGNGTLSWQALNSLGGTGSQVLISPTAPTASSYDEGTLWWNSDDTDGSLYVNYDDPSGGGASGKIWIAATPQGGGGGGGINNLSEDTSPELGGNLDVLTYDIVSSSNRDIDLDPNGSGSVVVKGNSTRGSGDITLNCEFNSHGVKLKGPAHSAGATYTMTLPTAMPSSTGKMLTSDTNGNLSFADPVPSSSITSTELASGSVTSAKLANDITIAGNLTVNGTTTTVNSTTLTVDDKNIELGSVSTPSDTTADGGGITLKGATDKTIVWSNSTDSWTFNQPVVISPGGTERLRFGSLGQVGIAGANYGTTGQVLMSGGSSAAPTWGDISASPTVQATASGTLADGTKVVVNTDGTVSAVTQTSSNTPSFGSAITAAPGSTDISELAYNSTTGRVVYVYVNTNNHIEAVTGTISGSTINWATPVTAFASFGNNLALVSHPSDNRIVLFFRNISGTGSYVRGVINNDGSITFTSASLFSNNSVLYCTAAFTPTGDRIAIGWSENGQSKVLSCKWNTDNSLSQFSNVSSVSSNTAYYHKIVFNSTENVFVYCRTEGSNLAIMNFSINSSNGNMSFHTGTNVTTSVAGDFDVAYDSNVNKVFFFYQHNQVAQLRGYATPSSGFTADAAIQVYSVGIEGPSITFDDHNNKLLLLYKQSGANNGQHSVAVATGSGTTVTSYGQFSTQYMYTRSSVDGPNGFILFSANPASSPYTPKIFTVDIQPTSTNLTAANFIGISNGAYTNGQTATIQVVGSVDDAQSGLTAGTKYFVQPDGTLATSAGTPSVEAGVALSSTKLLIK